MLFSVLKNLKRKVFFELRKLKRKESFNHSEDVQLIIKEIKKDGFCVVPDFYSKQQCDSLKKEIDRIIKKRKKEEKYLWLGAKGADKRCFCAEDDSDEIKEFFADNLCLDVAQNYFGAKIINSNTLAAKINYAPGNIGSGEGWHRDGDNFQFKAMVYLSDVKLKDGPFQIIKQSHKLINVIRDSLIMKSDVDSTRYSSSQIQRVIEREPDKHKVLTAKAGTLIFADTSCLHAGLPLKVDGERYALFNYYFPSYYDITTRRNIYKKAYKR